MADVTSYTQARIDELIGALVESAAIDPDTGAFTMTTQGGQTINVGNVLQELPIATTTVTGGVALASADDMTAGTDTTKAVTPADVAGVVAPINTAVAGKQASNANLTSIAGLTMTNDNLIQIEGGAFTSKTPAAIAAVLAADFRFITAQLYSGSSYGGVIGAMTYVGAVDPGSSAANGSVWFDTSGS